MGRIAAAPGRRRGRGTEARQHRLRPALDQGPDVRRTLVEEGSGEEVRGLIGLAGRAVLTSDVLRDGKPQYRIERRVRSQSDFVPTCWWQQSSPESHFTHSTICSRLTESGRITSLNQTLAKKKTA